jgi:hypothetical protein
VGGGATGDAFLKIEGVGQVFEGDTVRSRVKVTNHLDIGFNLAAEGVVEVAGGGRLEATGQATLGNLGDGRLQLTGAQLGMVDDQVRLLPSTAVLGALLNGRAGVLEIEVAGVLPAVQYDQLVVDGDLTMAGLIDLVFSDGFAPQQGQQFEFLTVGGQANLSGATFVVRNLQPGFQFSVTPTAGGAVMTALNDGVFVPEPCGIVVGLLGAMAALPRVRGPLVQVMAQ